MALQCFNLQLSFLEHGDSLLALLLWKARWQAIKPKFYSCSFLSFLCGLLIILIYQWWSSYSVTLPSPGMIHILSEWKVQSVSIGSLASRVHYSPPRTSDLWVPMINVFVFQRMNSKFKLYFCILSVNTEAPPKNMWQETQRIQFIDVEPLTKY